MNENAMTVQYMRTQLQLECHKKARGHETVEHTARHLNKNELE
jgi:hypothetical protein